MKLTGKKIKSMLLCMMLTMAMAITAAGCGSKTERYNRYSEKYRDINR